VLVSFSHLIGDDGLSSQNKPMAPNEAYPLFRYNVRFLLPLEELTKFITNVVNFHHGQPYCEHASWFSSRHLRFLIHNGDNSQQG